MPPRIHRLTLREGKQSEYFRLRWQGFKDAFACDTLGIKPRTAKTWRKRQYERARRMTGKEDIDWVELLRMMFDWERLAAEKGCKEDNASRWGQFAA